MSPRPPKFTFYLDENFPVAAGKFFRSVGHRTIDGRRHGASRSDFYHIDRATKLGAVLVSLDRDFLVNNDLRQRAFGSAGVLYIETTSTSLLQLGRLLRKVLTAATANSFRGKLCVVSSTKMQFIDH